jgi:siroheme synthase
VVVMMGLAQIDGIASRLLQRGWNGSTASAVLLGASTETADVWESTLGDLARGPNPDAQGRPATVVIGDVVRIRQSIVTTPVAVRAASHS